MIVEISCAVFNADNELVRTLSSAPSAFEKCAKGNEDVRSPVKFKHPATKAGYNEFVWDLRREPLNCIENVKLFGGWNGARDVRAQLDGVSEDNVMLASDVSASIERIVSAIDDWEALVIQPKHQTFEDDINWPNMLDRQVRFLMDNFDRTGAPAQAGALKRLEDLEAKWQQYKVQLETLFGEEVKPLNEKLSKQGAFDLESL